MNSPRHWPRDPKDKASAEPDAPPDGSTPIVDPGEAERARQLREAKLFTKRPDNGLPPD